MNWQEKIEVQKGNLAEAIVDRIMVKRGYMPYLPGEEGGHPFDRLYAHRNRMHLFPADVKGKPARTFWPDTGIDIRVYREYCRVQETLKTDMLLFFVDEDRKRVYGGTLNKLSKPTVIDHRGKQVAYPLEDRGIIYFPLENMTDFCTISDEEAEELKRLSTRKTTYAGCGISCESNSAGL